MTTQLILAGGFLGAGKTTLLLQAARLLAGQGRRVGMITNDQGHDLADTALAAQNGIPVTEVVGGCFCCRFPDLLQALHHLQTTVNPDVILAEPVGSCTDLVATIVRPLRRYYPDQFQVAPLTILLDAQRDLTDFSPDVAYLYERQLAEADLLVLNKADLLSPEQQAHQQAEAHLLASQARLLTLSAHTGEGVAAWLETVLSSPERDSPALDVDYGRYAAAEAELGWLNARGVLLPLSPVRATVWATHLLNDLAARWEQQSAAIAHVKLNLPSETAAFKVSLTQRGGPLVWDMGAAAETETNVVEFILNARVDSPPEKLAQTVRQALEAVNPAGRYELAHFECFSPAPPQPTYRL
jgi:G3E family GTPase